MNNSYDFQKLDKSNFFCFKNVNSYYFGEIAYLDQEGNIFFENPNEQILLPPIEDQLKDQKNRQNTVKPEEIKEIKLYKRIRHGNGVQIYIKDEEESFIKYEGQWEKDKRHGYGTCIYSENSYYKGFFKNDIREGLGVMKWEEGWKYEGNWKEGRLNGKGVFITLKNETLNGEFKNNNFLMGDTFLNPFSIEEINTILSIRLKKNDNIVKINDHKLFMFEMTNNLNNIKKFIEKSFSNERIPIIIRSNQRNETKEQLLKLIFETLKKEYFEFNFRETSMLQNTQNYISHMKNFKENLAKALIEEEILVLNIDDYKNEKYDENYDVDIREFYDCKTFPSHILNPKILSRPEIFKRVLENTKYENSKRVKNLKSIYWSKFQIDQRLDNKTIVESFERRFSRALNLNKIDLLILIE